MNIIPWRRGDGLLQLRSEFDDFMNRFLDEGSLTSRLPRTFRSMEPPALNMAETDKSYIITLDLPGMNEEDIQVSMLGDGLLICGERKWEQEKKAKEFHRVESQYGAFERRVALPPNARCEPDAIVATYKKGMLEVVIPKVEPTPIARIAVKKA